MTNEQNEQKAREIAEYLNQSNGSNSLLECHQAAMAMAQWKDEQLKIVVNKLLKKLAKYDMLDATLCASGLLNLSKQEAQQYIKTLLL